MTKLSTLCFFVCLTGEGSAKRRVIHRSIIWVEYILISAFVLQGAFWTVNAVMDALTQVFIGLLPIYIIHGLKLEKSKKQLTILLALPLLDLRLVYFYDAIDSTNCTWDAFNLALVTNLHTSFAIILSCIPFSKSIIDSLIASPHIITDNTRGTISNRLNNSERGNKSNTGGSSDFLSGVAARTTTIITVNGGEARELNMYFNFAESQERMIPRETIPMASKGE
ncbi:hypothetical protein EAF04_008469 [Stromatinia cepivora]|nr:hypothetical protein EAF04_008469 [Stromatinia cepivora]